jgi:pimeloyl-ACP methyl ester carboxylesterase
MKKLVAAFQLCAAVSFPMFAAQAGILAQHQGRWMGDLVIPNGPTLKCGLEIFTRSDGSVWASFASPDQGAYHLPVESISEVGDTAQLELGFGEMSLAWKDGRMQGVWKQGGAAFPLELTPVAAFPRKLRAQDPQSSPSYVDENLAIRSVDGVTLSATLSVPAGVREPSVVILVHGSGPATRDEEFGGHRPFAVLADYLARQGVAVLRYDKRGIMQSTGDYVHHTQAQLADDLLSVIQAARARMQFRRVGVIAHSEGPMIAARVAAMHPQSIDFLVSLAGVGLPGMELILMQDRLAAQDRGATPSELERLARYERSFYGTVVAQPDPAARVEELKQLLDHLSAQDSALVTKYRMNVGTLSLKMAQEPALRVLLTANPSADWSKVRCPVLALNGTLDHQVPVESLDAIMKALRAGGNRQAQGVAMPSLNHMFQTARTGAEDEYGKIEETIAPVVLERIVRFIRQQ